MLSSYGSGDRIGAADGLIETIRRHRGGFIGEVSFLATERLRRTNRGALLWSFPGLHSDITGA